MKTVDIRLAVSDDMEEGELLQAIAYALQDCTENGSVLAVAPLDSTGFGSTLPNMDKVHVVAATVGGAIEARRAIQTAQRG